MEFIFFNIDQGKASLRGTKQSYREEITSLSLVMTR